MCHSLIQAAVMCTRGWKRKSAADRDTGSSWYQMQWGCAASDRSGMPGAGPDQGPQHKAQPPVPWDTHWTAAPASPCLEMGIRTTRWDRPVDI